MLLADILILVDRYTGSLSQEIELDNAILYDFFSKRKKLPFVLNSLH